MESISKFLTESGGPLPQAKNCVLKAMCNKPVCEGANLGDDGVIRLTATYTGGNWGILKTGNGCIIFPRINMWLNIVVPNRGLKPREYSTNEQFLAEFADLKPYQDCPNAAEFLKRFNF